MNYSQSNEQQIIGQYFKDHIGYCLDIGANDGVTLSNTRALIERGWIADLIDPSPKAFAKLKDLYKDNSSVSLHNVAIGDDAEVILYESGSHLKSGDVGLLSSTMRTELERWHNEEFTPVKVKSLSFESFLRIAEIKIYDFISIDAEGVDWQILQQIDLTGVGCKLLCIEWNGNRDLQNKYNRYCQGHGLFAIHINSENIIYGRVK